jgi:hypothetical protein
MSDGRVWHRLELDLIGRTVYERRIAIGKEASLKNGMPNW